MDDWRRAEAAFFEEDGNVYLLGGNGKTLIDTDVSLLI